MNRERALAFLRQHQPMPRDAEISQELIEEYEAVRRYFLGHPDPESIPLLLGSFGDSDGFGVYQVVEDVFVLHSQDQVIPHLIGAVVSDVPSVRYWSTQIAADFPDPRMLVPLGNVLDDPDSDTRAAAVMALMGIDHPDVIPLLRARLDKETDEFVGTTIRQILAGREAG